MVLLNLFSVPEIQIKIILWLAYSGRKHWWQDRGLVVPHMSEAAMHCCHEKMEWAVTLKNEYFVLSIPAQTATSSSLWSPQLILSGSSWCALGYFGMMLSGLLLPRSHVWLSRWEKLSKALPQRAEQLAAWFWLWAFSMCELYTFILLIEKAHRDYTLYYVFFPFSPTCMFFKNVEAYLYFMFKGP